MSRHTFQGHSGFTLIEMMIALALVLILSYLALPTWHDHMRRMHRAQARAAMIDAALALERQYLATLTYGATDSSDQVVGTWPQSIPPTAQPVYRLEASACGSQTLTQCAELRAVPLRDDPQCGTLILRTNGETLVQSTVGGDTPQPSATGGPCW